MTSFVDSPWVDYSRSMEIILNPDSTGSVFQGDGIPYGAEWKLGQLFPKAKKIQPEDDVEPCEKKNPANRRMHAWFRVVALTLYHNRSCFNVFVMYQSSNMEEVDLDIFGCSPWSLKDGHHRQFLLSDPSDHTSPVRNNGSGWTRSLIPRDFLVPKVHVHSFGFPKRVGRFKMVGFFPKKRLGEHVHCLIEDSPVLKFIMLLQCSVVGLPILCGGRWVNKASITKHSKNCFHHETSPNCSYLRVSQNFLPAMKLQ